MSSPFLLLYVLIMAHASPSVSSSHHQKRDSLHRRKLLDAEMGSHSGFGDRMAAVYPGEFGEKALANLTAFRRSLLREVLGNAKWGYTKKAHERFDLYPQVVTCPPGKGCMDREGQGSTCMGGGRLACGQGYTNDCLELGQKYETETQIKEA